MLRTNRLMQPATALRHSVGVVLALAAIAGCAPMKQTSVNTSAVADFKTCSKPVYPHGDLHAGHTGTVSLSFLIGVDGMVRDAKIVKSSGYPGLDEAARDGIMRCTFKPATKDGQPVESWAPIKYVWTLS